MSSTSQSEKPPEEYNKDDSSDYIEGEDDSSIPIVPWVTLTSIAVALIIAAVSVLYDCSGVAYNSEQCLWSRGLYLLTAGICFVITWPILWVISLVIWGDKNA